MRVSRTLVVVLCLAVLAVPAFAESDRSAGAAATITLDGFQPEVATSYSFGVSNVVSDTTGGGGGVGKVTFSDFTFTKKLDAQSSRLFKSCATGVHFKSATIVMRDAKGNTSNQIVLSDVFIKSIQTSADGNSVNEVISLTYAKIEFSF